MSRNINLANATNSLTDTSARHHKVGRVCVDWYNSLVDPTLVANSKDDYRAIRFEVALGIGRTFSEMGYSIPDNRGLAPVFTNTAALRGSNATDDLVKWYVKLYNCRSIRERTMHIRTGCTVKGMRFWPSELYFAGIVMSDGEAHPINGDTAITLFIGGQITIRNGRFPMRCGDEVQWYLDEEADANLFDEDGLRVAQLKSGGIAYDTTPIDAQSAKIQNYTYGERALTKSLARIKPCRWGVNGKGATIMDRARVFGIATIGAGPFEMVDIKVSRQSL